MKNSLSKFFGFVFFLSLFLFLFVPSANAIGNPVKISNSSNDVIVPQITTDSNGYLHLVWQELTPGQVWSGLNPGIYYSRWNGDVWSTPLKISENTGFAEIPSVAVDTSNTLHTVWDDETLGGGTSKVAYKTRTSTGTWSSIETLPTPNGTEVNWNAKVAIGLSNVPSVTYVGNTPPNHDSIYWTQKVTGAWTTPTIVSKDTSNNNLIDCQWSDLKSDSALNLHLTYWCFNEGVFYRKYSSGAWSTPVQITDLDIELTKMAVTSLGEVFVSYFVFTDSTVRTRWTQSGVWQSETTLTTLGDRSFWGFPIMGVTTDSKERAHIGWGEKDPGDGLMDLKYKSFASGVWGPTRDVDLNNNDADTPYVFPDKWDNQHFVWAELNPSTNVWEIYYRVAEGTIQTVPTTGGTITVNPNNTTYATLVIPNGALSASTEIGVQIGPVPETVSQSQITIPRAFTFRPHGLTFNSVSTATVFYNETELAGADERELKPWFWNGNTSAWEARTGTVNRAQNRIAVDLSGFSLYGISAPLFDEAVWSSPASGATIKSGALQVEFALNYKDGTEVVPPAAPDELYIAVKDAGGNVKDTLYFGPNGINKTGKNSYKATLNLQKSNYENGQYSIEIYMADVLVGTRNITLSK